MTLSGSPKRVIGNYLSEQLLILAGEMSSNTGRTEISNNSGNLLQQENKKQNLNLS